MMGLPKQQAKATHQDQQDVLQQFSFGTFLHSFHILRIIRITKMIDEGLAATIRIWKCYTFGQKFRQFWTRMHHVFIYVAQTVNTYKF